METIEKIKENIILQSKYYLEKFEGFYPFGCAIDKDDNLKPISVFMEDDSPEAIEVLYKLIEGIKKGVNQKDYKSVGIATDVSVIPPNQNDKIDAVELRIWDEGNKINIYVPYIKGFDGKFTFLHPYEETGTLDF